MTKFLIGGFILLIEIPLLGASLGPGLTSIVLSVILGISILMLMGKTLGGKLASYPQSSTTALVLFYLFIALQVISYLRATLDAQIETKEVIVDIILVISICAAALACYSRKDSFNSDFPYLVFHSIGIYVVVDAILFVLGIGVDTSDLYADTPLLLN